MSSGRLFFVGGVPDDVVERVSDDMQSLDFLWCVLHMTSSNDGSADFIVFTVVRSDHQHNVFWFALDKFRNMPDAELYSQLTDNLAVS